MIYHQFWWSITVKEAQTECAPGTSPTLPLLQLHMAFSTATTPLQKALSAQSLLPSSSPKMSPEPSLPQRHKVAVRFTRYNYLTVVSGYSLKVLTATIWHFQFSFQKCMQTTTFYNFYNLGKYNSASRARVVTPSFVL